MEHFPRYWPFVREIHRSSVNSPHKGQWRSALMFSLICARTNGWVNNRNADDLGRHRAHYDVTVMTILNPFLKIEFEFELIAGLDFMQASDQSRRLWLKQVWRARTSNYIPQHLWDVITSPCHWYLLLPQHSWITVWFLNIASTDIIFCLGLLSVKLI